MYSQWLSSSFFIYIGEAFTMKLLPMSKKILLYLSRQHMPYRLLVLMSLLKTLKNNWRNISWMYLVKIQFTKYKSSTIMQEILKNSSNTMNLFKSMKNKLKLSLKLEKKHPIWNKSRNSLNLLNNRCLVSLKFSNQLMQLFILEL